MLRWAPRYTQPPVCSLSSRRSNPNSPGQSSATATAALDKESTENRYVDLRTLKTIPWEEAQLTSECASGNKFGPFENACDDAYRDISQDLLFSHETIPLSQSQRDVVRAILSRRSVIFFNTSADPITGIVADLALRAKLWNQTILYCSSSVRAAESLYAALSVQLSGISPNGIILDSGDANTRPSTEHVHAIFANSKRAKKSKSSAQLHSGSNGHPEANEQKPSDVKPPNIIITVPHVLMRNLTCAQTGSWMKYVDVAVLDNLLVDEDSQWEELLLSMPSRVVVCLIAKDLSIGTREQLLLWFETVHNNVIPVIPPGAASVLDRVERCVDLPSLRAFVFNAAYHSAPVQVSLRLLLDAAQKERSSVSQEEMSGYLGSLLQGVTVIEAMKPEDLLFRNKHEAEYADFVSLLLHDFVKTSKAVRLKFRKRSGAKKSRTASSLSAARKRRSAYFADSLVYPAIVLIKGRFEAVSVANALLSACDDKNTIVWDDGSREHLHEILRIFVDEHNDSLSSEDHSLISMLSKGVGVVYKGMLPAVRMLIEELFRDGFIPLIFVDTHLGPVELNALPSAKSIIVESSAFGEVDDGRKGLVKGSTAAALAGRIGKDDVGNLIVMWYDDSIDDKDTVTEMAAGLLIPGIAERSRIERNGILQNFMTKGASFDQGQFLRKLLGPYRVHQSRDVLWSSYAGLLRSLQKFGLDGYKAVLEYTLDSYQGWLVGATLRATREKMDLETKAIEERLRSVDWSEIGVHDRRVAKHQECQRILKAMESHQSSVLAARIVEFLRSSGSGIIIGVKSAKGNIIDSTIENGEKEQQEALPNQLSHKADGQGKKNAAAMNALSKVNSDCGSKWDDHVPAVFVSLLERSSRKSWNCPLDASFIVICIMMDGVWTMVPSEDVLWEPSAETPKISDLDLIEVPHLATFDLDPELGWAKCKPIAPTEASSLARISDELIAAVTSLGDNLLLRIRLPEFMKQQQRLHNSWGLLQKSPWFEKEEELQEIRQLRRQAAKLKDDTASFKEAEIQLEQELNRAQENRKNLQKSRLAVLEDCNAVRIKSEIEMEMTPIGALSSILPGSYPLFTAACLLLVEGVENLSPMELTAFVAIAAGSYTSPVWSLNTFDDELPVSKFERSEKLREETRSTGINTHEVDELQGVLPSAVMDVASEILKALHMLQYRHEANKDRSVPEDGVERVKVATIAPAKLDVRFSRPAFYFARGDDWESVVSVCGLEPGDIVSELRKVSQVLSIVASGGAIGEFSSSLQETAQRALGFMERWPVRDVGDSDLLISQGVIGKEWQVQSYERWWKANRSQIQDFVRTRSDAMMSNIETVVAEVIE